MKPFAGKDLRKHKAVKGWPKGEFPIYPLIHFKWLFFSIAKSTFLAFLESIMRICTKYFSAGCTN